MANTFETVCAKAKVRDEFDRNAATKVRRKYPL